MPIPAETIVAGTSRARREFARLFEAASKGTPVTIVAGERQVTMVDRDLWLALLRRAGRGVGITDARRVRRVRDPQTFGGGP